MNFKDTLIQTVHIPCGDLSEDFVQIMIKSKIQLMMNGDIIPEYLNQEYSMADTIAALSAINPDIKLGLMSSNYDVINQEYVLDFMVKFLTPEAKEKYVETDLDEICILPLVLEYEEVNGEYIPKDIINFVDTMERFQTEVAQWMGLLDLHGVDSIHDIEEMLGHDFFIIITLGEVAYVIFESSALDYETDQYELIEYA